MTTENPKELQRVDKVTLLKEALSALNEINCLDPTGDQWRQCSHVDILCSVAGAPIWDALGTNHIPTLDKAKEVIEEAIDCLGQEDDKLEQPSMAMLTHWMREGVCEAACPCQSMVEPDGYCHHGKPSWMLVMGLI